MSRQGDIIKTRSWSRLIEATTGGGGPYPLGFARHPMKVIRCVIIPRIAFAENAADYWTLTLEIYDAAGSRDRVIPRSSFGLDKHSLAVGQAIIIPAISGLNTGLKPGYSLVADLTETASGTAAAFGAVVQADLVIGG